MSKKSSNFAPEMKKGLLIWFLALSSLLPAQQFTHLDGRFRQVRESSMLSAPQIQTGRITFDAPDRVSWRYDDGLQSTLPDPILRFISAAVSGSLFTSNDDFNVTRNDNLVTLTPKKARLKKLFDRIEIHLAPSGLAEQVLMHEPTGDLTHITFTDMTAN